MRIPFFIVLSSAVVLLAACSASPVDDAEPEDRGVGAAHQEERWTASDDPSLFSADLERRAAKLPSEGEAVPIPWAGNFWPTANDSINYRWDGPSSLSPAKKYEKAFGLTGVEDKVSEYYGIDSQLGEKACSSDTECNADLAEVCAKRTGAASGRCIPTWFGICDAWSAAALLFPEPRHEVVKNGVTFKVQDIKALLSLAHDHIEARSVSLRCNANDSAGEVAYDDDGRPPSACRDTNPGTFHIVLANYIGLRKKSFVFDRTFDYQVWNQPLRGYTLVTQKAVTAREANALIGVMPTGGATARSSGTVAKDVWSSPVSVPVTAGSSYRVLMRGKGDADLYVRFGAPPTPRAYACRPYLEGSSEECAGTVPAGETTMFVMVRGGGPSSSYALRIGTGAVPESYALDADATSWVYVKNDVSYIGEAGAEEDGNLASSIDDYTSHVTYEYILELDAAGAIIGGEWVSSSKREHPDFLWLPLGPSADHVAGGAITYDDVKALAEASVK